MKNTVTLYITACLFRSFFLFSSHIITLQEMRIFILPEAHVFLNLFCFKRIKNLPHDKNAKNKKKHMVSGRIIYRMDRREEQDGKKRFFFLYLRS